ncbi:MAG: ParB/RepB/Spo0J family partition protein [Desulfovibrionaceae bacterium]|nr:ParB/RepB/Spo0J family partition protein [Desulfovibrionaceae bacterium]
MTLFSGIAEDLVVRAEALFAEIAALPFDDKVKVINQIRRALHDVSPFAGHPVDCVLWVPGDKILANDYNPNTVAPPEMRLLERSIRQDGYTQPIVSWPLNDGFEVVDGFHRNRVGRECRPLRDGLHGYLPVTVINHQRAGRKDRIAATIRHNRARGVHGVVPMVDIVSELLQKGWTDEEVAVELGMDADEVLRFKQNSGLPELFKDHEFGRSWE